MPQPEPDKKATDFNAPAAQPNRQKGEFTAKSQWDFWFQLKECSRLRQWQKLLDTLDDNKDLKLSNQQFTEEAFHAACNLGRTEVIDALMTRGFILDEEAADKLFERIGRFYPENAVETIGYFSGKGHNVKSAVYQIAMRGKSSVMAGLKGKGCDVLQDGSSFFLAFDAGNIDMMHYLASSGANLFAPAVIGMLYKEHKEDRSAAKEAFTRIVHNEGLQLANYYAYIAPNKPDMADFRDVPFGLAENEMTLMHLAARTGYFHEVSAASTQEKRLPLKADDFLRADKDGTSVLAILLSRGEYKKAFAPELWQHAPGEIKKLTDALKALRAEGLVDPHAAIAAAERFRLRQLAPAGRWSLKPKTP